jgi:hypothetical protein
MADRICIIAHILLALLLVAPAVAQFDSTSDGSDGALVINRPDPDPNPNEAFVFEFGPDDERFDRPLDPDRDNVYHFTTITVGPDVTVKLSDAKLDGPVYWLAQGNVVINGAIDLNGANGDSTMGDPNTAHRLPAVAGAGGFGGGVGSSRDSVPGPGLGPGGGRAPDGRGGGAGHATAAVIRNPQCGSLPGDGTAYGNAFLVPLVGGSGGGGGGGGTVRIGGGGGAGGGAILIASNTSITLAGRITANGGAGGAGGYGGGGGSGGAVRLAAATIAGNGNITATGGMGSAGFGPNGPDLTCGDDGTNGSVGRIRIEAFDIQYAGQTNPSAPRSGPVDVFLPPPAERTLASLRVVSVNRTPLQNPSASLILADVVAETRDPIEVEVEARNIPLGTVVNLRVISENATDQVLDSTPLAGTRALSAATVTIPALPPGFSRAFARAEWSEE